MLLLLCLVLGQQLALNCFMSKISREEKGDEQCHQDADIDNVYNYT